MRQFETNRKFMHSELEVEFVAFLFLPDGALRTS